MTHRDAVLRGIAQEQQVTIEYARTHNEHDGVWLPRKRIIRLRPNMHARLHRSVLAHELAHAVYGDIPSPFGPVHMRQEHRAEAWAAAQLIDLSSYRQAETVCEGHAGAMAVELGVMRSIVSAYQSLLERVGETVYVDPHMGAGQWSARVDVG